MNWIFTFEIFAFQAFLILVQIAVSIWLEFKPVASTKTATDSDYDGGYLYARGEYFKDMAEYCQKVKKDKLFFWKQSFAHPCDRFLFSDRAFFVERVQEGIDKAYSSHVNQSLMLDNSQKDEGVWVVFPQYDKRVKIDYNWKAE
jgi:hypothetical protein